MMSYLIGAGEARQPSSDFLFIVINKIALGPQARRTPIAHSAVRQQASRLKIARCFAVTILENQAQRNYHNQFLATVDVTLLYP